MQQFEIVLKNSKIRSYRFFALLLVFLNLAVFILLLVADVHFFEAAAALFLLTIYCVYRFYLHKKYNIVFFVDEVSFFIIAGCWSGLQNYSVAFASILLGILYHLASQKLLFIFNAEFIKKMNFPQVEYSWGKLANVLIKDNIVTLDFKNNRLIQEEIDNAKSIDEAGFNHFAQQQLIKSSSSEKIIY